MTLQERVLEALGEKALTPRTLYAALSGELASAIDFALGALMKRGAVTLELGHYHRTNSGVSQSADKLSKREREIWDLVSSGHTNKQVAERLGISPANVSVTLCSARRRLGINAPAPRAPSGADAPKPNVAPAPAAKQPISVSRRVLQGLERRRAELAATIEAAEAEITVKREELLDLVQFLNWVATQTGMA